MIHVAVGHRIARASYGTLYNVLPFEASEHHAADRVWCDIQQEFLAVEQTHWFVKVVSVRLRGIRSVTD